MQFRAQLADPPAVEADGLLQLARRGVHFVLGAFGFGERVGLFAMLRAPLFHLGLQGLVFAPCFLQANFQFSRCAVALAQSFVHCGDADGEQLRLASAFLRLQRAIAFGGFGLAFQMRETAFEVVADVGEAGKVLLGMADAVLRFAPPLLVLRDARRLFKIGAQGVRLGFHQFGDHALLDDRIAARAEAGAEEDVGDVSAPATDAVQRVDGLRIAADLAADGDFRIGRELAADAPIAVVEDQLDGGEGGGLARRGTVEDDIGERFAAQLAGGAFAHHPTNGVDDVRLSAAVGADHRIAVARQNNRRRIHEGLEPNEFDFFESHSADYDSSVVV